MRVRLLGSVAAMVALALAVPAQAQVTNGGFETGDFTGWIQSGNTDFTGVDTFFPHTGDYAAFFGNAGSTGSISQSLTTTPGQEYTISFWLMNEEGDPNSFEAAFGGITLMTLTDAPDFPYTLYTFTQTASSASTLLSFTFRQDSTFWDLDDVSVVAAGIPEPATWAMMMLGLGMAGIAIRRQRRRTAVRLT
jgi:hypothetical protein